MIKLFPGKGSSINYVTLSVGRGVRLNVTVRHRGRGVKPYRYVTLHFICISKLVLVGNLCCAHQIILIENNILFFYLRETC